MMNKLLFMMACGVLVGCDYTVPLVKTPEMAIDSGIVGLWQKTDGGGQTESLLILPLNTNEYLIAFPAGSTNAMFARACLCHSDGKTLAQLTWIGTAQGAIPEDNRVFQFASYSVTGDSLTINLLNADLVKRDVKSSAELAKAIVANKAKPNLYREAMVFKKIKR